MTPMPVSAAEIVTFWHEAGENRWFSKDAAFDTVFHSRFHETHMVAARGELDSWCGEAEGALALLILLDQFPRNCFRGTAHMFATDGLARRLAYRAIDLGHDIALDQQMRVFFYLPLMHSEVAADQARCAKLCAPLGEVIVKSAAEHFEIIERFGRFPHRNRALGRETTVEEQRFLDGGGFSG